RLAGSALRRTRGRDLAIIFSPMTRSGAKTPHPAHASRSQQPPHGRHRVIPTGVDTVQMRAEQRTIQLTNLRKPFWPQPGLTKGDLLQYYVDVSSVLLPHLHDRAMVMRRYPNGAAGASFFMKRAPSPRPDWIEICAIEHSSGNIIDFPIVQDLPALLWLVN